ncbi:MAG TPA: cytochrome c biogenesis protein CcsA [Acidimicrobiales bacterium]|nr:cytochrome c biogenesis protein CcsA [Acidimicrobiales bacterium]
MKSVRALGALAVVTLAGTFVLGLGLPATYEQRTYSRMIALHPPIAWTAYLAFGVTALASMLYLWPRTRRLRFDAIAAASAELGVLFTGLTLITGSLWGRPTWGVWWTWDARLTTTALMFVIYLGYLAQRGVADTTAQRAKRSAIIAVMAVIVVPINHMSVEWWRTLHQGRSLASLDPGSELDGDFIAAMLLGFLAMTLTYAWLLIVRVKVMEAEADVEEDALSDAIEARRREAEVVLP